MNAKDIIKETIIDTGRAVYDNTFNVLNTVQEHGEKVLNAALDKAVWINEENRKAVDTWIANAKKGQENVKALIDENFKNYENFLNALIRILSS